MLFGQVLDTHSLLVDCDNMLSRLWGLGELEQRELGLLFHQAVGYAHLRLHPLSG
jgi:hypothetical protein